MSIYLKRAAYVSSGKDARRNPARGKQSTLPEWSVALYKNEGENGFFFYIGYEEFCPRLHIML
ncbi:hypothetical protein [Virgibacillus senegalensis]|uniref:hypothetical protein n=1 Tax=Virgibacillus senegalensis TaxID=1499679 RepID=UPI0018FEFD39|nr:hypothetical protein [Virgibacillus senegalensis]